MYEMEVIKGLFNKTIEISLEKLYIELTNRCNLQCIHCYNESNNGVCIDLSLDIVKGMLQYAKESNLTSVALSGGEALLHPQIEEIFEICKELEMNVLILTNGTYLCNRKYFSLLLKYLPDIQISLDGPDEDSNDKVRGKGSFEKTLSFIQNLKECGYPKRVTINTVLTEYTLENYGEMVTLSKKLGIDELTYSFITMAGRAKKNSMLFDNEQFYNIVKDINTNIKTNVDNKCQGIGINHTCSLTRVQSGVIKLQPKVTCQGNVYPCQMHQKLEYTIGNLYENSLKGVLNGEASRRMLALMYLRKSYMEECSKCLFENVCGRGCMAKAVNDYNNPISVDGCCKFYKELLVSEIRRVES